MEHSFNKYIYFTAPETKTEGSFRRGGRKIVIARRTGEFAMRVCLLDIKRNS